MAHELWKTFLQTERACKQTTCVVFQDSRIRDMEHLLKRYKKMEEHILQTQGKQGRTFNKT